MRPAPELNHLVIKLLELEYSPNIIPAQLKNLVAQLPAAAAEGRGIQKDPTEQRVGPCSCGLDEEVEYLQEKLQIYIDSKPNTKKGNWLRYMSWTGIQKLEGEKDDLRRKLGEAKVTSSKDIVAHQKGRSSAALGFVDIASHGESTPKSAAPSDAAAWWTSYAGEASHQLAAARVAEPRGSFARTKGEDVPSDTSTVVPVVSLLRGQKKRRATASPDTKLRGGPTRGPATTLPMRTTPLASQYARAVARGLSNATIKSRCADCDEHIAPCVYAECKDKKTCEDLCCDYLYDSQWDAKTSRAWLVEGVNTFSSEAKHGQSSHSSPKIKSRPSPSKDYDALWMFKHYSLVVSRSEKT